MLVMVFFLPLHTVFLSQWISWKPFLIVLLAIAVFDLAAGWAARVAVARARHHRPRAVPRPDLSELDRRRLPRSLLAATSRSRSGGVVMLVVERGLREPNSTGPLLRTVFWSAAALGASAVVFAIVGVGALGSGAIDAFNDIPGVFRIFKPAYLTEGFVAVTNWHQDPGYSAAWMNLWAALALVAAIRRFGSGRWWADGAVIGALGLGTFMTMSRTGWVGFAAGLVAAAAILAIKDRVALRPLAERLIAGALVFVVLLGIVAVVDRPDIGNDLDQAVAFRLDQRLTLDAGDAGELGEGEGVVDARSVVWPQYVDAFLDNPLRESAWAPVGPRRICRNRTSGPRVARRDRAARSGRLHRAVRCRRVLRKGHRRRDRPHRGPHRCLHPDGALRTHLVVCRRPLPRLGRGRSSPSGGSRIRSLRPIEFLMAPTRTIRLALLAFVGASLSRLGRPGPGRRCR